MTYIEDSNPVFAACEKGDAASVREFLDNGGSVYAESRRHNSLIATSCSHGYLEIVDLLLKNGLDPNRPFNDLEQTPIYQAITYRQIEIARRLIEGGADVNARDRHESTPLAYVVGGGNKDLFDLLMKAGAELDTVDFQKDSLIHTAARNNRVNMLEAIMEARSGITDIINLRNLGGSTPLKLAAGRGSLEATKWLLEHGADPTAEVGFLEETPLDAAWKNGHSQVAELIERHLKQTKSSG